MRIATIKKTDISNGFGIRVSVFVSGCRHACKGCFNSEIWDFKKGDEFTQKKMDEILEAVGKSYIKGISFLGGEPLEPKNLEGVLYILEKVKEKYPNKNVWLYTGFVYEYIYDVLEPNYPEISKIFNLVDVLVDGRFELDLLDLKLQFRGSKNQRVIDMKLSTKEKIVWALDYEKGEEQYIKLLDKDLIDKRMDKLIRKEIDQKNMKKISI